MESSIYKLFQVADYYMYKRKPRSSFTCWSHFLIMFMAFRNRIQRWKCVCTDLLPWFHMTIKKITNSILSDLFNNSGCHKPSSLTIFLYCYKGRLFTCCSSATFSRLLASDISIVKFDKIFKSVDAVSVHHGHAYFSKHAMSRYPANLNLFTQSQSRNTAFVRSHKIYCPKPFYQWQVG